LLFEFLSESLIIALILMLLPLLLLLLLVLPLPAVSVLAHGLSSHDRRRDLEPA